MVTELGRVEALFRYRVKSMRGAALDEATLGWHGLAGDRRFAVRRLVVRGPMPWLTASRLPELIHFAPFGHDDRSGEPLPTHVRTPEGDELPLLGDALAADLGRRHGAPVEIMQLGHGIFDETSISVITSDTSRELCRLAGVGADVRRFRPNIVVGSIGAMPLEEDGWVGDYNHAHTWLDTFLSFLANLILAFPVILLFYLLVTPEITAIGLPSYLAAGLFLFPILFLAVLIWSRFHTQRLRALLILIPVVGLGLLLYLSLINQTGTPIHFWPLDLFDVSPEILIVFVSVVFVNSPTVFRIVRGLTMDIKTRDYVAAAQTRGEGPWYIMLWEILPNARGPLIVDFCLRIGYTTILLGTLGFFGLGLPPDSPDWGSTINAGRQLLAIYPFPALVPAVALLSLVLGLNLLADGLREESLKD